MAVQTAIAHDVRSETWERARRLLAQHVLPEDFRTWFDGMTLLSYADDHVRLGVPGNFRRDWIQRSYGELLSRTFESVLGRHVEVHIVPYDCEAAKTQPECVEPTLPPLASYQTLNKRYRFENFVVGLSNKMCHAACLSVARTPSGSYNPLFLYGGTGLGKTHLMQAIGHSVAENHPHLSFAYMSAYRFLAEYVEAIKRNERFQFQSCFRGVDVLLIDDIHLLSGKEGTQEEFFHTFNELHNNHKQIVISSDKPPKDIQKLEERLRSRFEWGLMVEISPPDYETRLAILCKKAEEENLHLARNVLEEVAASITSSIRELESALISLGAHAKFSNTEVTPEVAKKILKPLYSRQERDISVEKIQKRVAEHFRIKPSDIMGRGRSRSLVLPRQIAMYLSRALTNHSLPEIGTLFGNKDHTTILFACRKIEAEMNRDPEFRAFIESFMDSFN